MTTPTVSDRIQEIMDTKGENFNSFSKKIGLTNNVTISRIIKEKRKPSFDVLEKICVTYPDISADWLITGSGTMLKNNEQKVNIQNFLQFAIDNNEELLRDENYRLLLEKNVSLLELSKVKMKLEQEEKATREKIKNMTFVKNKNKG